MWSELMTDTHTKESAQSQPKENAQSHNFNEQEDAQHLSSEHLVRIEKVKAMAEEGKEAWPSTLKKVTHTTAQAIVDHQKNEENKPLIYALAGRMMSRRDHGKTYFAHLQDRAGSLQLYIKLSDVGEETFEHFKKHIDIGDIIWVTGTLFVTKMGEITLHVTELFLLSKSLYPLPEKHHGLVNTEQRYRQRYLDLMSNPESREKFKQRSAIIQGIRNVLLAHDFLEVETPMLHPIPGGAAAKPFVTHHNAYDMSLYLRIAPELYLKRLVVGGLERVFEINRCFRNEGISTKHNPEFTTLELYMAHGDYKDGIRLTEEIIRTVAGNKEHSFNGHSVDFSRPFKQCTVEEALIEYAHVSADQLQPDAIDALIAHHKIVLVKNAGHGVKLFALFEELVEPIIVDPVFVIGHPVETSPLAKRDPEKPHLAARFELFMHGMELANGFTELNDPFDQAARFRDQVASREAGDDEAHHYDADFVHALEYGLPPTVGVGIGIDRLTMMLTNTSSIKDVILFPTLKLTHT